MVKNHLWVFINAAIENPAFDSQTKETLTTVRRGAKERETRRGGKKIRAARASFCRVRSVVC
jgi:DNA gyrase/topoisomerase IV subunit B